MTQTIHQSHKLGSGPFAGRRTTILIEKESQWLTTDRLPERGLTVADR